MNKLNRDSRLSQGIILMLLSSFCGATGQLLWKLGTENGFMLVVLGFVCYVTGVFIMIKALKFGELSVLYPVMSFSYIMALVYGKIILEESISSLKVVGILSLAIGLIVLNLKEKERTNNAA